MALALSEELNMFTRKPSLLRRNRAVTLIEAVLYISIALALIVGGLVFFQQASTAARTSATVRQLSAVLAEARVYLKGVPVTGDAYDVSPILISAGAVPQDMVKSPTELTNPFGGTTRFFTLMGGFGAGGRMINVRLTDVPQGVCVRLLTATSGTSNAIDPDTGQYDENWNGFTTIVSSEQSAAAVKVAAGVASPWRPFAMNPTQAGWMCKYGSGSYDTQASEPSSTPHSGNVEVNMQFRLVY
jgi:type II secretory pathway pseudopilin PulG